MTDTIDGLKYLKEKLVPLDVVKVYNHFQDIYRTKHLVSLLEARQEGKEEEYLLKRDETWFKYVKIHYSDEAIVKRELDGW